MLYQNKIVLSNSDRSKTTKALIPTSKALFLVLFPENMYRTQSYILPVVLLCTPGVCLADHPRLVMLPCSQRRCRKDVSIDFRRQGSSDKCWCLGFGCARHQRGVLGADRAMLARVPIRRVVKFRFKFNAFLYGP